MFKTLAILLVEMVIIHIESKYAKEYNDLANSVKIKGGYTGDYNAGDIDGLFDEPHPFYLKEVDNEQGKR